MHIGTWICDMINYIQGKVKEQSWLELLITPEKIMKESASFYSSLIFFHKRLYKNDLTSDFLGSIDRVKWNNFRFDKTKDKLIVKTF